MGVNGIPSGNVRDEEISLVMIAIAVRHPKAVKERWVRADEYSFTDVLKALAVTVPTYRIRFVIEEDLSREKESCVKRPLVV